MTTVKKYLHSRGEPGHGDAAPSDFSHSPALAHRVLTTGQKIRPAEQNTAQGPRLGGTLAILRLWRRWFLTTVKKYMHSRAEPGTRPRGRDFSHSPVLSQMALTTGQKNTCTAELNRHETAWEGTLAILRLWRRWFLTEVKKYMHSRALNPARDRLGGTLAILRLWRRWFLTAGQKSLHAFGARYQLVHPPTDLATRMWTARRKG